MLQLGYRFEAGKNIYLKAIVNTALDCAVVSMGIPTAGRPVWGYGLGIKFMSIIGPMELIVAEGEETPFNPGEKQLNLYVKAGYVF